ncbi:MAG: FeoA family protein [Pseudomonadota bacterium]|nr:FeoA family protein [Pseudomonadota bacterium]
MSQTLPLSQLAIGQAATVESFINQLPSFQQICQNLGIKPGSSVEILRKAPGKGPLQIKVLGTLYSMRESDAQGIRVSL